MAIHFNNESRLPGRTYRCYIVTNESTYSVDVFAGSEEEAKMMAMRKHKRKIEDGRIYSQIHRFIINKRGDSKLNPDYISKEEWIVMNKDKLTIKEVNVY